MKDLQSLDDVFNKKIFRIPDYQRGYAWGKKQLVEFWDDLISLDDERSHYTGVLSIKSVPEEIWNNWNDELWLIQNRRFKPYFIVDGQQRLTTISIFLQCLMEIVQMHADSPNDVEIGTFSIKRIVEDFIVVTKPGNDAIRTYKFGYEVDNPSFEFLRYRIFNEPSPGTMQETFYTLNLENAKTFFKENLSSSVKEHGIEFVEKVFKKLTQQFLFNLYELDDNFDVYVAFETMNNRGKPLSDLELLKNRLIYLTTLYSASEVEDDDKENARDNINKTWGEIYNQLGRNKKSPLNDDDFLRAHWIMYFKYSRQTGQDYIRFLLDDYFSPKNIFEKLNVSTAKLEDYQELTDELNDDYEDSYTPIVTQQSKLSLDEINRYVASLREASRYWYASFFPAEVKELNGVEKIYMDRINRVKIGYFRPLVMAILIKYPLGSEQRLPLLKHIERFIFIIFRLSRFQSNYRSSVYYRAARAIYFGEITFDDVIVELEKDLLPAFGNNTNQKVIYFKDFISKKFAAHGQGFYDWNDLNYVLYEYEESLRESRGQPKIAGWQHFTRNDKDKVSIEHIFPQTPDDEYWRKRFGQYTIEQQKYLNGSLGNLLPLSSSINSSLQNDAFNLKKDIKLDAGGKVMRNGYKNGSYSELEVANWGDSPDEWDAEKIKDRGIKLLAFMESRWQISMGNEEEKMDLLHLDFLMETNKTDVEVVTEL